MSVNSVFILANTEEYEDLSDGLRLADEALF